ncbi:hypothetical protein BGZ80_005149 [Entomortierella chlamydospora]|uniref:Ricin B lectin domain-containing protein n=1 Tax=Entomortierella chlamydospora TaxID=101097 RepID=A0A9P6SV82_9FUNG|nr:hypothetical protein BGZ80_005149 [Entomortierella chlamydospora]
MTRSLIPLVAGILALVSFVHAGHGPMGPRRIHRHGEVLTALNKAVNAPVNIIPGRGHGQVWEIMETKDEEFVHIYQMDSGLFLAPQNREDPMPYTPLVLSPFPQKWKLVECEDCHEDEDMYLIELNEKIDGKTMVLDNSRIHVYPPMAGLVPKERGNRKQMWEFEDATGGHHRRNRPQWE